MGEVVLQLQSEISQFAHCNCYKRPIISISYSNQVHLHDEIAFSSIYTNCCDRKNREKEQKREGIKEKSLKSNKCYNLRNFLFEMFRGRFCTWWASECVKCVIESK